MDERVRCELRADVAYNTGYNWWDNGDVYIQLPAGVFLYSALFFRELKYQYCKCDYSYYQH